MPSTLTASKASPALPACPDTVNGVDVAALMTVITAVQGNPEIARFNFRATNRWLGGDRNRTTMKEFTGALMRHRTDSAPFVYDNSEPGVLLGEDKAPNPAEWLLHALVGCITTATAYHAAAKGIAIRSICSEIDGDIDLRGFLGLSDTVRKGYSDIRVKMKVGTKATPQALEPLARMSPMLDVVSRSVPVALTIETV